MNIVSTVSFSFVHKMTERVHFVFHKEHACVLLELNGFKRFCANFISMSNSEYVQVEHAEAFDLRTVDSMEVEGEDTSDTR